MIYGANIDKKTQKFVAEIRLPRPLNRNTAINALAMLREAGDGNTVTPFLTNSRLDYEINKIKYRFKIKRLSNEE
jgi:hypothetical protein